MSVPGTAAELRTRTPIRFRRCLAPARAIDSICRFRRALLPKALPEVATLDTLGPHGWSIPRHQGPRMSKRHARPSRTIVPGGGWDFRLATLDFQLPWMARPPIAPASIREGGWERLTLNVWLIRISVRWTVFEFQIPNSEFEMFYRSRPRVQFWSLPATASRMAGAGAPIRTLG